MTVQEMRDILEKQNGENELVFDVEHGNTWDEREEAWDWLFEFDRIYVQDRVDFYNIHVPEHASSEVCVLQLKW